MVPTSSISKMFDIIRNEDAVSCYSTEQLREILYCLQHEDLTRLYDDYGHPLLRYFAGVIRPVVNPLDMEKIIRLRKEYEKFIVNYATFALENDCVEQKQMIEETFLAAQKVDIHRHLDHAPYDPL